MMDRIVPLQVNLVCYEEPKPDGGHDRDAPKWPLDDENGEKCDDDDEMLDCILPPVRWEDGDGTRWTRKVSKQPATRADVVELAATLDSSLRQYRARDTGICPTRRALYTQCFDEILRQIIVYSPERGLLLMKIRDELKMTMDAYRTLYESNVQRLGSTGPVYSAESDLQDEIAALEAEKQKLELDLTTAIMKNKTVQSRGDEQRAIQQQRHDEKMESLQISNRKLITFLDGIKTLNK